METILYPVVPGQISTSIWFVCVLRYKYVITTWCDGEVCVSCTKIIVKGLAVVDTTNWFEELNIQYTLTPGKQKSAAYSFTQVNGFLIGIQRNQWMMLINQM